MTAEGGTPNESLECLDQAQEDDVEVLSSQLRG